MFRTLLVTLAISTATVYANEDGSNSLRGAIAIPELIGAEELADVGSPCIGCCTYYGVGRDNCQKVGNFCSLPIGQCRKTGQAIGACEASYADCVFEFDPVCGCDGKSYDDKCLAKMAGVNLAHMGKCKK